ncbi:hypothetical protein [Autumnicola musiva]|uniref:PEP-CTERM sorting domain-containing protein n=1 Tax=Autumnicola musiva TaxID=3075589 RepID=A0ABU3D5B6_9FLAO|nr:hypothetical protein [Zunongwangia sp. F117]MDT0676596.1 hypothetical protein [Zunongwangia sp. F117]
MNKNIYLLLMILLFSGCSDGDTGNDPLQKSFNFNTGVEEWQADFADYPEGEESFYELEYAYAALPSPLDQDDHAIKQSGNNHSDDLFMFIKRKITGLKPNSNYDITFTLEFATNAPDNSFGVGGSPGSSVYIKAGASQVEPVKELDDNGIYRMNIDKGNQAEEGEDMINLGDFSNGLEEDVYALKTLSNQDPFVMKSDENGEIWVIVGTDSGFEAATTIYYNNILIRFD